MLLLPGEKGVGLLSHISVSAKVEDVSSKQSVLTGIEVLSGENIQSSSTVLARTEVLLKLPVHKRTEQRAEHPQSTILTTGEKT